MMTRAGNTAAFAFVKWRCRQLSTDGADSEQHDVGDWIHSFPVLNNLGFNVLHDFH